jgi:ribosomal protein S18 acetylase RimI-like enzyme
MPHTNDQVLSAVRRSGQFYFEQITDQHTLSSGIAHCSAEYPLLAECNHLREVILPQSGTLADFYDEVQAFYADRNLTCHRWVPAADTPIEPLEAFLTRHGYVTRRKTCMVWADDIDLPTRDDVRILPGRPMRQALRDLRLTDDRFDQQVRAQLADSRLERMDDPTYDAFVAMQGKSPVASGVLIQVGDIARVENIFVGPSHRRQGIATHLMHDLLALARRLAMRITVLETESDNHPAIALYQRCGFTQAGSYVQFIAPEVQAG